jgi:DNA (cytosine-5)-methyltransferase 1
MDLFAGCGGLSLGLEQAGFEPVFVNELNKDAMETYLLNREKEHPQLRTKNHVYDVKDLVLDQGKSLADIAKGFQEDYGLSIDGGDLDLVVGGPPCQGYSGIGHRRSYSVDRVQLPTNHLYEDMAFVIHRLQPKMFLFENVKGLLSARWTRDGEKGEIWSDVFGKLSSIPGYSVRYKLVHAKDYGVPQNRPRVLVAGMRNDVIQSTGFEFQPGKSGDGLLPSPSGEAPDLETLLSDLLDRPFINGGKTAVYQRDPENKVQQQLRCDPRTGRVLLKGDPLTEHEYSRHSPYIVEKFEAMLNSGGQIPEEFKTKKFAQRVLPRRWGPGGPMITATSLPDDYVHYEQPRTLTVREWARLQMFPDWYRFAGKRTTGGIRRAGNPTLGLHDREVPKYTQIGNAVPVGLAQAVGEHFRALLTASPRKSE